MPPESMLLSPSSAGALAPTVPIASAMSTCTRSQLVGVGLLRLEDPRAMPSFPSPMGLGLEFAPDSSIFCAAATRLTSVCFSSGASRPDDTSDGDADVLPILTSKSCNKDCNKLDDANGPPSTFEDDMPPESMLLSHSSAGA